jgi:uncharacterized protein YbbC (DUF1343 family)
VSRVRACILAFAVACTPAARTPVIPVVAATPPPVPKLTTEAPVEIDPMAARFAGLDPVVEQAIEAGKMPGCVIVVGRSDGVVFEKAYGARALQPDRVPMTTDTVFDIASLTKAVATTTSLMILVDRGAVDLDARASRYVPELASTTFTVRHLLLHTSGLPPVTAMADWGLGRPELMRRIGSLKLKTAPGEQFVYSDVGFVVLQEIVERATQKSLAEFTAAEVFSKLEMSDTGFLPDVTLRARAAPTEQRGGVFMRGDVHDPRAFALGGVAGHAGVFSTGRDLARFARAMLRHQVVGDATFDRFLTRVATPKGGRALGWDIDSVYATHRSPRLSPRAFGHGGFTGTALWIDPERDAFFVFLSNRVHPDGKGAVNPLIGELATLALGALDVRTGIDVLVEKSFEPLKGERIALLTNAAAKARDGTTTLDLLRASTRLTAVLTPEHGLGADREGPIADATYAGIPVYSTYGARAGPPATLLSGVDTLVVDLQDAGLRFYTYASTMQRAIAAAAAARVRVVVLDRPNPIDGVHVQGPVDDGLPIRHGMTMGELATMFSQETDVRLDVVRLEGWRRADTFEKTGLTWSPPSPNLRTPTSVALYPLTGLFESTNLSVGRGTDLPFEILAAPWLDAAALGKKLEGAPGTAGLAFEAIEITPTAWVHARKKCRAIRIRIVRPALFEPIHAAIAIAAALREQHPVWTFDAMNAMLRSPAATAAIKDGKAIPDVEATWAADLGAFLERREHFLLYR